MIKKYVSWRDAADEANTQVAAHEAEIKEETLRQPGVVAAQQALDAANAIVGHDHEKAVQRAQEDYNTVITKHTTVHNRYIQVLQQKYIEAAKAQGNYYDETGVKLTITNEQRIADDIKAQTGKDVTVTKDENGNYVVKTTKKVTLLLLLTKTVKQLRLMQSW